jgi:CCR4-NOT transcriptional complex subunit CAF120
MDCYFFSCPSAQDLTSWVAAFRLSCWEKSRLEEIYTAHLIRIITNDGENAPSTLTDDRLEGYAKVKIAGQTHLMALWICVSTGGTRGAVARSLEHNTWDSPSITPKKRRIPSLFSRNKSNDPPERANISLWDITPGKDRKNPLLTFEAVTRAFAIYPQQPDGTRHGTLIKLEGTYGNEEMCGKMKRREGWMLLLPGVRGVQSTTGAVLRLLVGGHTPFAKPC